VLPPVALSRTETLPPGGAEPLPKTRFVELLADAREHTLALVDPVCEKDLDRVHDPLMSPLVWDLGHIGAFEDLWVCRASGLDPLRPDLMEVYDATETPRSRRGDLPYLRCDDAGEYMHAVRERALAVLEGADLSDGSDPLNGGGFVWEMIVQLEEQHAEPMLQTRAIAETGVFTPSSRGLPGEA
jgi:iron(II)-dependent oxidoreductase